MSIEVKALSFSYGNREVLNNISFSHAQGVLCLLGPNGVGKSTLFRCLLGLSRNYSGTIEIDGQDMKALNARDTARLVAYVPQSHTPGFAYSVSDMVLMGTSARSGLFAPGKAQRAAAREALEWVGIAELSNRDYTKISGGERQLTLIARALAQQSGILVMDEPTANLDYGNQLRILRKIRELADRGFRVVLSTHHPDQVFLCADRVLALYEGRVAAYGEPCDVLTSVLIERLYGERVRVAPILDGRLRVTVPIDILPFADGK